MVLLRFLPARAAVFRRLLAFRSLLWQIAVQIVVRDKFVVLLSRYLLDPRHRILDIFNQARILILFEILLFLFLLDLPLFWTAVTAIHIFRIFSLIQDLLFCRRLLLDLQLLLQHFEVQKRILALGRLDGNGNCCLLIDEFGL